MGDFSLDTMNDMYMDVLKEIGNVGAGNATTAIAGMLGARMNMMVPKVELVEASKLGDAICPEEETIVGIFLEVQNDRCYFAQTNFRNKIRSEIQLLCFFESHYLEILVAFFLS